MYSKKQSFIKLDAMLASVTGSSKSIVSSIVFATHGRVNIPSILVYTISEFLK